MVDEIYDRGYQGGRAELHAGIGRLADRIRKLFAPALSTLYHIEWDAPWNARSNDKAKA